MIKRLRDSPVSVCSLRRDFEVDLQKISSSSSSFIRGVIRYVIVSAGSG